MNSGIRCAALVAAAACALACVFACAGGGRTTTAPEAPSTGSLDTPLTRDGVSIRVTKIVATASRFTHLAGEPTNEPVLRIDLNIRNVSQTRKIDFRCYADSSLVDPPRLRDNHGNNFGHTTRQLDKQSDLFRNTSGRFDPGGSINETLLFELPLPASDQLTLTLPKKHLGASDDFVFVFTDKQWLPSNQPGEK